MNIHWKEKITASFTIEAALIMPVVFFALVLMIASGYELHDIVTGNLVANEVAELYSHLPEDGDKSALEGYGNQRLGNLLSNIKYSIEAEDYKDGSHVALRFSDGQREYEDPGNRPEKMMRKLTLIDAITN